MKIKDVSRFIDTEFAINEYPSNVFPSRLSNKIAELDKKFENQEVPRPDFWGGFEIEVNYWEFWQGRRNRTHDRFCYTQNTQGWNIERMSP